MNRAKILLIVLAIIAIANIAQAQNFLAIENPQHNAHSPLDVNDDGLITPADLLLLIDRLQVLQMSNVVPLLATASPLATPSSPTYFYDTNNDSFVTASDALLVVDHFAIAAIAPEPSSLISAGMGIAVLAGYAWRCKRHESLTP